MTNEQTRIFLNNYKRQLESAIEKVKELLPDEANVTEEKHYVAFPSAICIANIGKRCPEDHYRNETITPALEPLYALLNSIDEDLQVFEPVKLSA